MYLVALAVLAADLASKKILDKKLSLNKEVPIGKGTVCLKKVYNRGAAFGFLTGYPVLLSLLSSLAFGNVLVIFKRTMGNNSHIVHRLAAAFLLGGSMGNMLSRCHPGYVVDFLCIKFKKKAPIFNIADIFIALGTVLLFFKKNKTQNAGPIF